MNVLGYVVRFCTLRGCKRHTEDEGCCNPIDSKYYISPDADFNLVGAKLVVAHEDEHMIGSCVSSFKSSQGVLVHCIVDDAYFLECVQRQYNKYRQRYNKEIASFQDYCKKALSSFSLSHDPHSGAVKHIALVSVPGRIGTAVTYYKAKQALLKRRVENSFVADSLGTHATAYSTIADRKDYQTRNTLHSHNPADIAYLEASKDLLPTMEPPHKTFESFLKMYNTYKRYLDEDEQQDEPPAKCQRVASPPHSVAHVEAAVDSPCIGGGKDTSGTMQEDMVRKMREEISAAVTEAVKAATTTPTVVTRPSIISNGEPTTPEVLVEASRPQQKTTTITTSASGPSHKKMIQLVVDQILRDDD